MRTFSKAYGLAGMRIGYAIGTPDTIRTFDKIRNHFGMTRLEPGGRRGRAEGSGLSRKRGRAGEGRPATASQRSRAPTRLTPLPSATNFVTIDCGRDGRFARAVLARLVESGVFVRMPGVAPLDRCIRVSTAPEEELAVFERMLAPALEAADADVGSPGPRRGHRRRAGSFANGRLSEPSSIRARRVAPAASSVLVIIAATSPRSSAARSEPLIAAMLNHLCAATRSIRPSRPVAWRNPISQSVSALASPPIVASS